MKNHALILFVLLFIVLPSTTLAQTSYLNTTYEAAGGAKSLDNIEEWRQREKKAILTGIAELPDSVRNALIASGDAFLNHKWSAIRLSDYAEFKENGNRVNFEHLYLSRRSKLSVLCAAELASGNGKYLSEIVDGIWLILEESTWVLPAHLYTKKVTFPDPSKPIIDLFAAETAAHLAWIKLLLEDQLNAVSPVLIKRIDAALQERILQPYLGRNDYWWMGFNGDRDQNNWNIWINSNVLKVVVLTENQPGRQSELISKIIRSADKFVDDYPADGGCDEGPAYWSAAGGCLGEFLNVLHRISSGKLDWSENVLFKNIGNYIYKVHISGTRFVNFADAPGAILPDPGRVFNFGEMYNDQQMKHFAAYLGSISGGPSAYLAAGSIISFANNIRVSKELSSVKPFAPLPLRSWLPDLQIINVRAREADTKGLTFMAKGGNNGESHNHNDVGNFMIYKDGDPVLIDLGKGTYTKQTFSADRYKLWYTQSQWHNCPIINGTDQHSGQDFKALNVKFKGGTAKEALNMDLSKAYPGAAEVRQWQRQFTYNRKAQELVIADSYELKKYIAPSSICFVSCREPIKTKDGLLRLTSASGSGSVMMVYDPNVMELSIEKQMVADASISSVWGESVYRIKLTAKSQNLKGKFDVKFH